MALALSRRQMLTGALAVAVAGPVAVSQAYWAGRGVRYKYDKATRSLRMITEYVPSGPPVNVDVLYGRLLTHLDWAAGKMA